MTIFVCTTLISIPIWLIASSLRDILIELREINDKTLNK